MTTVTIDRDAAGARTLSTAELEVELVGLAGRLAAAHCRFLLLLHAFDLRGGWGGPGLRSCAHWLSWRIGMDLRTAQEQLRVARALARLPLTTAAFAAGRLSYSKVRAITRVAEPDTEESLVALGLAGTASHVERVVALARSARAAGAAAAAGPQVRRSVRWGWADDGSLLLRARLPADRGAAVLAALDAFVEEPPRSAERPQPPPGPGWSERQEQRIAAAAEQTPGPALDRVAARRADALVALAEAATQPDTGPEPDAAPEPDAGRAADGGTSPNAGAGAADTADHSSDHGSGRAGHRRPVRAAAEVIVHLHVDTGAAEVDGGPVVPASTAQRLACTEPVRALLRDRDGNPLFLGRRRRLVSAAQLLALRARDGARCRFPGCSHARHLHAHHIVSWLAGGPTDVDNLVLLCSAHHALVHDHGYRLRWTPAGTEFHRPDGALVPADAPPLDAAPSAHSTRVLDDLAESRGPWPDTLTPTWSGERLDPDAILLRLVPAA